MTTSWISVREAWPDLGRKNILVTDGDITVRAWTVRKETHFYKHGIVLPAHTRSYFKIEYITHWIYIRNLPFDEFFMFFPRGNRVGLK